MASESELKEIGEKERKRLSNMPLTTALATLSSDDMVRYLAVLVWRCEGDIEDIKRKIGA